MTMEDCDSSMLTFLKGNKKTDVATRDLEKLAEFGTRRLSWI